MLVVPDRVAQCTMLVVQRCEVDPCLLVVAPACECMSVMLDRARDLAEPLVGKSRVVVCLATGWCGLVGPCAGGQCSVSRRSERKAHLVVDPVRLQHRQNVRDGRFILPSLVRDHAEVEPRLSRQHGELGAGC